MNRDKELQEKREYLLNSKSLYKSALYLAWPVVLQSLLQVSVGTIDMKMVGSVNVHAISAVGTSRNIIMILMVLVIAISTGTTALVARSVGQGKLRKAGEIGGQAFFLALVLSLIIIPIGLLTNEFSLKLLGVEQAVLKPAMEYMNVFFLAVPFFLLYFMAKSVFQGAGDTKTPLYLDLIMNAVNIIGNYIFIFGHFGVPAFGVAGAAMGTALSRFIGVILGWGALLSGRYSIKVYFKDMIKPIKHISSQIVKIGIPAGLQGLSRNLSTFALFAILARTIDSTWAVPAFVIGNNLNQYALMPGLAIGTAAATLSGMNIGAGNLKRAEESGKATMLLGSATMLCISLLFAIFAKPLFGFFLIEESAEILSIGVKYLIIIAIGEPFHGMSIISSRTMQGAGYTKRPFQSTFFSWVVVRILLAYVLGLKLGFASTGVWLAIAISNMVSGLIGYALFKHGSWKKVEIKLDA